MSADAANFTLPRNLQPLDIREAARIWAWERDYALFSERGVLGIEQLEQLSSRGWATSSLAGGAIYGARKIYDPQKKEEERKKKRDNELWEFLVPMPSAPIYSLHRYHVYQHTLKTIGHHSLRLLRRPWHTHGPPPPIKHLYLFHNGLNETERFTLYYLLADLLIRNEETACLIRPFPGHLTRFHLEGDFAELPLDRYLADPADFFRQYLRFMVESKWLLSALVPNRSYRVVSGLRLVDPGSDGYPGRADDGILAKKICEEWRAAFKASQKRLEQQGRDLQIADEPEPDELKGAVRFIRHLLGWRSWPPSQQSLSNPPPTEPIPPTISVLGYSLGGYLAQSAFFTWPFAISSCVVVCSGGPLEDIQLVKFAHAEEWKTVVHALRREVQEAMLEGRIRLSRKTVSGLSVDDFWYYNHIFNEVILQESRGSYQSRLMEYLPRLLFVVGGEDPIVSIDSVLQAAPKGGINMIEVAELSHFIAQDPKSWQRFSRKRVIDEIVSFAQDAEDDLAHELNHYWWDQSLQRLVTKVEPEEETPKIEASLSGPDQPLSGLIFQRQLDGVVERLRRENGWLLILRNQVPMALLGGTVPRITAAAVYHSEPRISRYVQSVRARGRALRKLADKMTLIIPERFDEWFVAEQAAEWSKAETAPSPRLLPVGHRKRLIERLLGRWRPALRFFDPDPAAALKTPGLPEQLRNRLGMLPPNIPLVNTLPDVWILLSDEVLNVICPLVPGKDRRERVEAALASWGFSRWSANECGVRADAEAIANEQLAKWLALDQVVIISISAAEFNQRYQGERVLSTKKARHLLTHAALAYFHSRLGQRLTPPPTRRTGRAASAARGGRGRSRRP